MEKRRSRPLRTDQGEYLRQIDARICDLEATTVDIRNEMSRYMCELMSGGEEEMKSFDYSKERVMCAGASLGFIETISKIDACNANLAKLQDEIEGLCKKRERLIKLYASASGADAQVFYLREVLGYTQELTGEQLGYSKRQIQRIEKRLKEGVRI